MANGVDPTHFHGDRPLAQRQLVYCSIPFRGLEYRLRYFPEIRQRVPDASCVVMSGTQLYGQSTEDDRRHYAEALRQAGLPTCAATAAMGNQWRGVSERGLGNSVDSAK